MTSPANARRALADGAERAPIRIHVHERGDRRIDGILRLIDEASRVRPLFDTMRALAEEVANITASDVVSVYLRESGGQGDELVMRANVGFPQDAVGRVRLRVGQGITGFVAECLRPVSVAVAAESEHYEHVPGLGEERFPSFLGVPISTGGGVEGVLVMQRRQQDAFCITEVALATALATTFGHALERSRTRAEESSTSRSARLVGKGISPGVALGRAVCMPNFDVLLDEPSGDPEEAFEEIRKGVERALRRLRGRLSATEEAEIAGLTLLFEDERLRRLAREECKRLGVAAGMRAVAATYATSSYLEPDGDARAWRFARAVEVEDLCLLVAIAATGAPLPGPQSVVVHPERLTALAVLLAIARRASAAIVGTDVDTDSLSVRLARAAELPVVAGVAGLYAWIREGDRALVDGEQGVVRVNPRPSSIAATRRRVSL